MRYITEGFDGFSKGSFENGGQNLYVSRKGVLQRIFQYDINQDGYPDLLFSNSQSMNERPPVYVYSNLPDSTDFSQLPSGGTYDGILVDLFDSGYEDLVIACQHNGSHSDVCAIIYFGNEKGFSEQYRMELPVPNSICVCAGDFNGDGKTDLAFISGGKLRVFYQQANGFSAAEYTDYDVELTAMATLAQKEADGLFIKNAQGQFAVRMGNSEGISIENILWTDTQQGTLVNTTGGSTEGLAQSTAQWKPAVLMLAGKQYVFVVDGDDAVFYTWGSQLTEVFRLNCPGVVSAVSGDLLGNGQQDLVLTVFKDRDEAALCRVYPGSDEGVCPNNYITVPAVAASSATVANLQGNVLIFSHLGGKGNMDVTTPVLRFAKDGSYREIAQIQCGDCMKMLAGNPNPQTGCDQILALNHKLNRTKGEEEVYIYLGGEDGYIPERRLSLIGHSAVDGAMCDFLDRGMVDVLLCNCHEDEPSRNKGIALHLNNGNGFDVDELPALHSHGMAVGDFRKSGALDIAVGGIFNREILILHGGYERYSTEHSTRVVLGPDDGTYKALGCREGIGFIRDFTEEAKKLVVEYGQVRWMMAADFNGDGWLDLFVSEICGPKSIILWGGPDGYSYENRQEIMTDGVATAAVADLNGNGWPDLILSQHQSMGKKNEKEAYVTVYWGGPDGYRENRKMQLPAHCANSVTVGDYNGNGSLDIYATSYHNGRSRDLLSYLYLGDKGKFSPSRVQYLFNHSGCGCVSGDFNGDGYTDLAVACHKTHGNHEGQSFIFWGGPDGLSEDRKTSLPTIGPHGMCTIDPGNILNRGNKEHYISNVFEVPAQEPLTKVTWEGECTSTSWVEVSVRWAKDAQALETASWESVISGEDISHLNVCGCVQYRLALCAKCGCGTPRITRVILD